MLSLTVYPIISLVLWAAFFIFLAFMVLRLIFNYSDPNPFGKIGRFSFKVRKLTEKYVYPAARFLANYKIDTRLAPLLTIFIGFVLTYFLSQIVGNTFFIIDGMTEGVTTGNPKKLIGFILYGLLSVLVLFIFIRFLSSWFVFKPNTFLGFVARVTDPIVLPVRKIMPPVAMFDLSPMIILIIIWLLQSVVLNVFVRP